jgi:hypothetical protein
MSHSEQTAEFFETMREISGIAAEVGYADTYTLKRWKPTGGWIKNQLVKIQMLRRKARELFPSLYPHTRSGKIYNSTQHPETGC